MSIKFVTRSWFPRGWKVSKMGHLEGDFPWIAIFKNKKDAQWYAWGPPCHKCGEYHIGITECKKDSAS